MSRRPRQRAGRRERRRFALPHLRHDPGSSGRVRRLLGGSGRVLLRRSQSGAVARRAGVRHLRRTLRRCASQAGPTGVANVVVDSTLRDAPVLVDSRDVESRAASKSGRPAYSDDRYSATPGQSHRPRRGAGHAVAGRPARGHGGGRPACARHSRGDAAVGVDGAAARGCADLRMPVPPVPLAGAAGAGSGRRRVAAPQWRVLSALYAAREVHPLGLTHIT